MPDHRCPRCLAERPTQAANMIYNGTHWVCPNAECNYKQAVPV